jgi:hypothetical protein
MGMTERDRKLLAIFAVIIFLGGYWFLVLGKKRSAVAEAQSSKVAAEQQLQTAIAAESAGKAEKKKFPVSYSRVVKMGKAIPVDSDFASLLVQVNDISDDSDVTFVSLSTTEGDASTAAGPSGSVTTCDTAAAAGASDATAAAAPEPAATSATGPTPQSGTGRTIKKAKDGQSVANADGTRAADSTADVAANCAAAPTLTDLAAVSSGLKLFNYSFTFHGSFFNLHDVYNGLLGMVRSNNGKVKVTGRLLQINTIDMSVLSFPDLTATVEMTGYALPETASITGGATTEGPAGTPAAATTPAASTGPGPGCRARTR